MRTVAFWLSLALVFTISWEDATIVGGWGTMASVVGLFTAMGWMDSALVARGFRKPHTFHIFLFLFILWNVMSFF
jgi:hypothetical protein